MKLKTILATTALATGATTGVVAMGAGFGAALAASAIGL